MVVLGDLSRHLYLSLYRYFLSEKIRSLEPSRCRYPTYVHFPLGEKHKRKKNKRVVMEFRSGESFDVRTLLRHFIVITTVTVISTVSGSIDFVTIFIRVRTDLFVLSSRTPVSYIPLRDNEQERENSEKEFCLDKRLSNIVKPSVLKVERSVSWFLTRKPSTLYNLLMSPTSYVLFQGILGYIAGLE